VRGDLLQGRERVPGTLVIEDCLLTEVAFGRRLDVPGARVHDFPGCLILPGFIDLHVHGGGGGAAEGGRAGLRAMGRWLASRGVTGFLASLPALGWQELARACGEGAAARAAGEPPNLLGLHLEGPFLSPARAGAQPGEHLRPPDAAEYRGLRAAAGPQLKLLTIAPELPGAKEIIASCRVDGVVAAVGHTDASYEEAVAGFEAGASHVTHLFNAMRPFHHRSPGAVGAALTFPGLTAELILDGQHVHRAAFQLACAALGVERLALVSDGLPCAGTPARENVWAGRTIRRQGGVLTLADGTLAGGGVALDEAVSRALAWGATIEAASAMASRVPAEVLGLGGRKGRLLPGFDADVIVVEPSWRVLLTLVRGRAMWSPDAA
jgi:N-acetylglucosamine-6-phosphate deacetylase